MPPCTGAVFLLGLRRHYDEIDRGQSERSAAGYWEYLNG
jgi:hypothetical protein